jgi:predicted AlkP superfamily phosphohydrolase/phosphomutase
MDEKRANISRREFGKRAAIGASALAGFGSISLARAASSDSPRAKKVLILGIDGMDPRLLEKFVGAGVMPNFKRLIAEGDFKPLRTSMPPQSPVAWSTFITGMDPGGHGIFDFIHRDPSTMWPCFSMSETVPAKRTIDIGSWVIPLSGGTVKQLRKGRALWQILEEHGVPTTVFCMPVNFPPVPSSGKSFSGLGTPDIQGNLGKYSFYTTRPPEKAAEFGGGDVYSIKVIDNRVEAQLVGPKNTFRRVPKGSSGGSGKTGNNPYTAPECTIDFTVFLDAEEPVAKFVVQDSEFILKEGEWSDWVRVDFEAVPWLVRISAIARFYLQQVRPDFNLYVTPLQINPEDPALPISTPEQWSHELYEALGYFYTQGLPADTKALSEGIFTGREFWEQSQFVYREQRRALDYFLDHFNNGLLFFYFSTLDQGSHMLWRYMDPKHPAYVPDEKLADGIKMIYEEMDEALGRVLQVIGEDTVLIVMSDHGFSPFYWGVNLNSWLLEKGYLRRRTPSSVDWRRTEAYAVGLNGVYVNLKGREADGIVSPGAEYDQLLDQLKADLLAMRDPRDPSRRPITQVILTHRDFHGPCVDLGPDIIIGYGWGYRSSWETPLLLQFPKEVFVDNHDPWSGDHCMDNQVIPGVLVTNQKITLDDPALYDLTVAVLGQYGIPPLPEMIGRNCLAPREQTRPTALHSSSV